jgi:hypothetical protein
MTKILRASLIGVGVAVILVATSLYALFQGYFDHGQFEIKQFQWSSNNQVAMVAERSDHDALRGLEYYVVVGNHLFTPAELRHAYYNNAVVFAASSNCLAVRWGSENRLIVSCEGSAIEKTHINAQRQQIGSVAISYENIALK